ncbi:MAG: Gfo/Idh/MocA family oxidoreductase [Planctomycetes bacterium]|nr:Gfo/Idh/MocA family oxidoreductase [Planctomycetota bacterium]
MSKKVRIGFVGVGGMGQCAHLRNYATLEDCEVVALAELREKTGQLVAQRYGVPRVYRDHKEMLATERLDGVVAAQPFSRHASLLPDLYRAVKHVFTEKPLAVMPESGEALVAAAAAAGCVHMVGYHKRSDPATEAAKKIIDEWKCSGEMGGMCYVRLTMPPGDWVAGGFAGLLNADDVCPEGLETERQPQLMSMSEKVYNEYVGFVNYYIHQVNLMRHLLGEPYEVVFSDNARRLLVARSAAGVTAVLEMAPYATSVAWEESALVGFEKGYVKLDLPAPLARNRAGAVELYIDKTDGQPRRVVPTMPWEDAMRNQARNFLRVCRGEMPPPCDAAEAVEDLKVAREYIRLVFGQ